MLEEVRSSFYATFPKALVDECLKAYDELKNHYTLGRHLPNEIEGGKFCEVVFRMLQHYTTGSFTPIGKQIDTEKITIALQNTAGGSYSESIRIHIPRMLRSIYDIRTKRDAAHLADGIDPNLQDSTLVVNTANWIMAELVRLFHSVAPDEAQGIIEAMVERQIPWIQEFDGYLKTLNPKWGPQERILATLYQRGARGASKDELTNWLKPSQRKNFSRAFSKLEHDKNYVHASGKRCFITHTGLHYFESNLLPQ